MSKTPKPRKPRGARVGMNKLQVLEHTASVGWEHLYPNECRKFAAWLLEAADYLEMKEREGKK